MLSLDTAIDILGDMMDLKFFPQSGRAIGSLAAKLMDACKGDESRLRWLVREAGTTMDEYPGPATLLDMLAKQYPPAGTLYATYNLGPKPVITPEEQAALDREAAELVAKIGITPRLAAPKRELPPLPEHPITADDFARVEVGRGL